MPMHDWTRVSAGTYHDFHCRWLGDLTTQLNTGLLPNDHYAQVEQVMEGMTADALLLKEDEPDQSPQEESEGGLALAVAPPRVRFTEEIEAEIYSSRARQIVLRHSSGDRMVAVIELISPGNKSSEYAWETFVSKSLAALRQGIHLLILDPFPPTERDPRGVHGAIWSHLGGRYEPPTDKPLTMAAYTAGYRKRAYVEPLAVGDSLTEMPLFLRAERYIPLPLEESYTATFAGVPRRYREVLTR